jgi:hypothetical protein
LQDPSIYTPLLRANTFKAMSALLNIITSREKPATEKYNLVIHDYTEALHLSYYCD